MTIVQEVIDAIDNLSHSSGPLTTDDTMNLIYATKRLALSIYSRGTVGIANLATVEVMRSFNASLSDLKED